MAESLDDEYGTCDEYNDPFCDPCFEGKGLNIDVHGYCKDCFQFLCSDCHIIHGKLEVARRHVILQGGSMPQSQANKPPKFEYCHRHPTLVKDKFCYAHRSLICTSCASDHRKCVIEKVAEVCKTVNSYETDLLYDRVNDLNNQAKSVVRSVQENIKTLREKKKQMLIEAQELHDKVISKVNKLLLDMQTKIEAAYKTQALILFQQQDKMNDLVSKFASSLKDIERLRGKSVDTKMFLKIRDHVTATNEITDKFRSLNESLLFIDLALVPRKNIEEFLSSTFTLGSVSKSDTMTGTNTVLTEILFPGSVPMKAIKEAIKEGTYEVKVKDDKNRCCIRGLAVAKDGRKLVSDTGNAKVKLFSHDMKFLSSVSVPDLPWGIAVISDREAVVTTNNKSLVTLDISGCQLAIKTTNRLSYRVEGISRYNDKLVVTSPGSNPPSVKLIDQTGRVYWSVSCDQQGTPLFSQPVYVSSPGDGRSSTVIVQDEGHGDNKLKLLNGDTGEVITRCRLNKGVCTGFTTDSAGNVYVCYQWANQTVVSVLSGDLGDLFKEKVLSSKVSPMKMVLYLRDLMSHAYIVDSEGNCWEYYDPKAMVYDDITHQLIVANFDLDTVHSFKVL